MQYLVTLSTDNKFTLDCNPSIRDSTLLLFSLTDRSLLASYSAGTWRSIIRIDKAGNEVIQAQ